MQTTAFGMSKSLWATLTEGSWQEAYAGFGASLVLVSNPAIQDVGTERVRKSSPKLFTAFQAFLVGALAKTISTVITYPAIGAKIMLQAAESDEDKAIRLTGVRDPNVRHRARSMLEAFQQIGSEEGVRGYFKGLHAQIVKTVLTPALMLMVKEKVASCTWLVMMVLQNICFAGENKIKTVTLRPSAVAPVGLVGIALASEAAG